MNAKFTHFATTSTELAVGLDASGLFSFSAEEDGDNWFYTEKIHDWLYLVRELNFFEGNRCNIWVIKGSTQDVIIDTGLGVCDLNKYLTKRRLIHVNDRPCLVICTHCHFDHAGGAHHFDGDRVYLHRADADALQAGRQTATLNYVKSGHFLEQPYHGFCAGNYCVPPTQCTALSPAQVFNISDRLETISVPVGGRAPRKRLILILGGGHTKGSIAIYYAAHNALFSGDFVYECGDGSGLIDWLPTSSVTEYRRTARTMSDWFSDHPAVAVYPGHFARLSGDRASQLLDQYAGSKADPSARCCAGCLQLTTSAFFLCGCFRCCPC